MKGEKDTEDSFFSTGMFRHEVLNPSQIISGCLGIALESAPEEHREKLAMADAYFKHFSDYVSELEESNENERLAFIENEGSEGIDIVSEYLREVLESGDLGEGYMDYVEKAYRRMEPFPEMISDMAKLRRADKDSEIKFVDLGDMIKETMSPCGDEVEIDYNIEGDCRITVGDPLKMAFRNLTENAIKHGNSDTIHVDVSSDEYEVRACVYDNGVGVPEDQRDKIFGRGQKGPDSDGTGLGLYITKNIVEKYGGEIEYEEPPGEYGGAGFSISMPRGGTYWLGQADFLTDI